MRELNWKEKLLVVGGTSTLLPTKTLPTITATAIAPSGGSGSFSMSQFIGQLVQMGLGSGIECAFGSGATALSATAAIGGGGAATGAAVVAGGMTAGACLNFAATPLGREAFQVYEDDLKSGWGIGPGGL